VFFCGILAVLLIDVHFPDISAKHCLVSINSKQNIKTEQHNNIMVKDKLVMENDPFVGAQSFWNSNLQKSL
jgi:hypothetical protein